MEPFNPDKRYLGPQGHWLTDLIPPNPPTLPQLYDLWNEAAYNHDVGYDGQRRKGLFGFIKDVFERKRIDEAFHDELIDACYGIEHFITEEQLEAALDYADLIYWAVRGGGWKFYRTGK
jgi:hypothetical protein